MNSPEKQAAALTASTTEAVADKVQDPNTTTVTLDAPLQRGGQTIDKVDVRKPLSGALRGISLTELLRMNVDTIQQVLPRVTTPTLLKHDVDLLDPADLLQLGTAVVGFLLPKAQKADFQSE